MSGPFKYILFFALPLMVFFTTCKKYPEDAKNLWSSPTNRLTSHSWFLKEFVVDMQDSSYRTNNHAACITSTYIVSWHFYNMKFDFSNKKLETSSPGFELTPLSDNNHAFNSPAYWNWKSNNDQIEMVCTYYACGNYDWLLFNCKNNNWSIKKLTDKEFIIENTSALGKLYRIKFQNIL